MTRSCLGIGIGAGLISIIACALGGGVAEAQVTYELEKGRRVLAPITVENLTLIPVVDDAPVATPTPLGRQAGNYLVLDEGMRAKKVTIEEVSDEGSVNELIVNNKSDRPLFLMSGEVIIGGKQDRIIAKNLVVPAKTRETVPVFCVEQGRWNGRKAGFESSGALAHTTLRKSANFKAQGDVWSEVRSKNGKRSVSNQTSTYRRVATDKKVRASIAEYEKRFRAELARRGITRHVGYVVALNGEVVALEMFGSPSLFGKLHDKLLRSYFVEAVDVETKKKFATPDKTKVTRFRERAKRAKKERVLGGKASDTYHFADGEVEGSVVAPAAKDAKPVYDGAFQ